MVFIDCMDILTKAEFYMSSVIFFNVFGLFISGIIPNKPSINDKTELAIRILQLHSGQHESR